MDENISGYNLLHTPNISGILLHSETILKIAGRIRARGCSRKSNHTKCQERQNIVHIDDISYRKYIFSKKINLFDLRKM